MFVKLIAAVVTLAAIALVVVINFSEVTQELTCTGKWKDSGEPEMAYVQLTEYRWWVRGWSESKGNVKAQTDRRPLALYVPHVIKIGDGLLSGYIFSA